LHGTIGHLLRHVRRNNFDHGDIGYRRFHALGIHHVSSLQGQQPGLLDVAAAAGDLVLHAGFLDQGLTKRHAFLCPGTRQLETALGQAHQTHSVLEPARTETTLGYFETAALTLDHVAHWHTYIVE